MLISSELAHQQLPQGVVPVLPRISAGLGAGSALLLLCPRGQLTYNHTSKCSSVKIQGPLSQMLQLVRGVVSSPVMMTLGSFPNCQSQLICTHAFRAAHPHPYHQGQLYCAVLGEVQGQFS